MAPLSESLNLLVEQHPEADELAEQIRRLDTEVSRLLFDDFFEPKTLIVQRGDKRQLGAVTPETLTAWTNHMAYSTRVRMRTLEPAVLDELTQGRVLPAMVLSRAHMESAGLAALSEVTLVDSAKAGDFEPLEQLYLRTLFGTSLWTVAKKHEELKASLGWAENQNTITIRKAIAAMDDFSLVEKKGRRSAVYAILCEYAHPNQRGVRGFVRSKEHEEGFQIHYDLREDYDDGDVVMALDQLHDSMRIGYGASELLRLASFTREGDRLAFHPPSIHDAQYIWTALMQLEPD